MVWVTLIDYGIGNILNVKRALEYCGAMVNLTADPQEIAKAELLVLPGVGAFDAGMRGLQERNLIEPIIDYAKSGRKFLGICLGMQLLFEESFEFGHHQGLGLIAGKVLPINPIDQTGKSLKVPHIGWSRLTLSSQDRIEDPIFSFINKSDLRCYFVHSFTAFPTDEQNRLADTYYGQARISAIVKKGNIYGCQFHPEKSGKVGLAMLSGFISNLAECRGFSNVKPQVVDEL